MIVEGPTDSDSTLADFDTVRFTRCTCDGLPFGDFRPDRVSLIEKARAEAIASRLTVDGTSFAVTPPSAVASGGHLPVGVLPRPDSRSGQACLVSSCPWPGF